MQQRMNEVVDGEYQNYKAKGGGYTREHFFGKYPELAAMVDKLSDDDIMRLNRGGHDPFKVYAAYHAAVNHTGEPTVILAKTVKGYGMGDAGEAENDTHSGQEAQPGGAQALPRPFRHSAHRQRARRHSVLPARGRQPGNEVSARPARTT